MARAPLDRRLRIFINYRREDAAGHAGRLYDALTARFGDDNVFMDVDKLEPGVDFKEAINSEVGACDVLIALIGKSWLSMSDQLGRRRLDNPDDYVRLEIQTALRRDVRVIPALVEGASMPASDELPQDIRPLADRHSLELGDGTRWRYDVDRLLDALERMQGHPSSAPTASQPITEVFPSDEGTDSSRTSEYRRGQDKRSLSLAGLLRKVPKRGPATLFAAALVILGVGAVVAVLETRGSHSRSAPEPMPSPRMGAFPDAIETQLLLAHIPEQIRGSCRRTAPISSGVFLRSVICQQGPGSRHVTYSRAHSDDSLRAYFLQQVQRVGLVYPTKTACGSGAQSADEWIRQGLQLHIEQRSKRAEGRVLCYANSDESWIIWTDTPTKILAIAARPLKDSRALYQWWRVAAGPEKELGMGEMKAMAAPYPDAIESELLLAHIPAPVRKTCNRLDNFDHNVFLRAVTCRQGPGEMTVAYFYAHTGTALDAYANDQTTAAGLNFPTAQNCQQSQFAADTWRRAGAIGHLEQQPRYAEGRILCYARSGRAGLEWTDVPTGIYASASRPTSQRKALYRWWQTKAGPGTLEMQSMPSG